MKFLEDLDWLFQIQNIQKKIEYFKEDEDSKAAEITYREDYQTINLKIYPCFFEESPEDQRKLLLHELCHTITLPMNRALIEYMQGKAITEETARVLHERATSQIENILDGLLQGRMRYALRGYKDYLDKPKKIKKRKKK